MSEKSLSDLLTVSSVASSQMKSVMTNVDMGDGSKDDLEEEEQEGEDDQ